MQFNMYQNIITQVIARLAFQIGIGQSYIDLNQFNHGAIPAVRRVFRFASTPELHDVSMIFDGAPL